MSSSLTRTPGTSLHRQLFNVLRDQITRGVYASGGLIPKEEELCSQFSVSRITVRRALADLEGLGLVEKRQGRGTFVSQNLPPARQMATLGFIETLRQVSDETEVDVLTFERIAAPGVIASYLQTCADDPALHVVRVRKKNDVALMITEAWVPNALTTGIDEASLKSQALYEQLLKNGVSFTRVVQEITAIAASPDHARLLDCVIGQPLVQLTRLIYDNQQQPVEYLLVTMTPERSRVLMEFAIDDLNTLSAGSIFHDPL